MDSTTMIAPYARRLEHALIHDFGARGTDLTQLADALGNELPDDLKAALRQTADAYAGTRHGALTEEEALAFVFRCGQLAEKLDAFRKSRAADSLPLVDTLGRPVADPDQADLDHLSRFIAARDRLLRKAADLSLKILVTAVLVLVLGFVFGLI